MEIISGFSLSNDIVYFNIIWNKSGSSYLHVQSFKFLLLFEDIVMCISQFFQKSTEAAYNYLKWY